jgi:TPR repeat protein
MNMVGRFLEEGWLEPPNPRAAAAWYTRAAEGGDFRAQYNLASLLVIHGRLAEALIWLRRALATASVDFLAVMAVRLAGSEHAELRLIAVEAQRRSKEGPRAVLDPLRAQPLEL